MVKASIFEQLAKHTVLPMGLTFPLALLINDCFPNSYDTPMCRGAVVENGITSHGFKLKEKSYFKRKRMQLTTVFSNLQASSLLLDT